MEQGMTYKDPETGEQYKISYSQELQLEQIRQQKVQNIILWFIALFMMVMIILFGYAMFSEALVL